jgi:hypothetical protein
LRSNTGRPFIQEHHHLLGGIAHEAGSGAVWPLMG